MEIVYKRSFLLLLFITGLLSLNCKSAKTALTDTAKGDCTITIYPAEQTEIVSPLLMGFNIVYNNATDHNWQKGAGKVPVLLEKLKTKILRYPGGTVTTFYHWNDLSSQGHKDSWSSSFDPSKNKQPASFMDLDEYLAVCQKSGITPLIGINMGSGMRHHRVQKGIEEAKNLIRHCMESGINVTYYYLDNEPYQHDANYTYTAEEYADMVNKYVPALKEINPGIRIIVNTKPIWRPIDKADLSYTKTLISKAGKNIDFIDVHDYWAWGHATFDHWKGQKNLEIGSTGMTYRDQRSFYKKLAASLGYPEIDMITLEWNIGQPGKNNIAPTQAEAALMLGEQFMQLIQSGMKMAALWPVSWPKPSNWSSRALLNAQENYDPQKVYDLFTLYKNIMGHKKVKNHSSDSAIQVLSVKSKDTLWIYLINKNAEKLSSKIDLKIKDLEAGRYNAVIFDGNDESKGPLNIKSLPLKKLSDDHFTFEMPLYSFAKITFIK